MRIESPERFPALIVVVFNPSFCVWGYFSDADAFQAAIELHLRALIDFDTKVRWFYSNAEIGSFRLFAGMPGVVHVVQAHAFLMGLDDYEAHKTAAEELPDST